MIDIKELMAGDWVDRSGTPPYYKVIGINSKTTEVLISQSGNDDETRKICWNDKLDPIPITPEILEKNGFEKTPCGMGKAILTFSDDYSAISIDEITDSIWRVEYMNREFVFPLCRELICHVHELQHFLRHHKIEKEITL